MNVTLVLTNDYNRVDTWCRGKNKPKTKPNIATDIKMQKPKIPIYIALLLLTHLFFYTPTAFAAPVEFLINSAYQASGMSIAQDIGGYEPAEPGTYPVYVWLTGTYMNFWNSDDKIFTRKMAERGFVAVSIEYDNGTYPGSNSGMLAKAAHIFDVTDPGSAINAICARPKANCSKRIVVSGFSQGANLASLAKNYDDRVEAAFLIGNAALLSCLQDSGTVITSDRIRSTVGAHDGYCGGNPDGVRLQQEVTTGTSCGPSSFDCIGPDGSGWYIVQTTETAGARDDHCFYYTGSCGPYFDANFEFGSDQWSLDPSLDWLASFICPLADVDDDCLVNTNDLILFAQGWLSSDPQVDIAPPPSGDGIVDYADVGQLARDWAYDVNLRAHWKLDGDTADSSTYNYTSVLVGDPLWDPNGRIRGAIDLDGSGDLVRVDNYYGVNGKGSRTVAAWIKTSDTGQIVTWGQQEIAGAKWEFLVNASGHISLDVGFAAISGSTDLRDGRWHHVAVVLDSDGSPNVSEIELYIDGTEEAVPSDTQAINTIRARKVKIGVFSYSPVYFNGLIDDVRIYNRPLSQAEITALSAM